MLQARLPDDPMTEHERDCFVTRTGLPRESIVTHQLHDGAPSIERVLDHDGLMIGGSGDYYVSKEDLPCFPAFLDLLREIVKRGHPTFASCFGFQSIVRALGGELVHDPSSAEVGTFELTLSEPGKADPLFGELPVRFHAQMGHQDHAARFADGMLNLASSERCRYQVLRVPDRPIWATQFHPELDRATNLDRFRRYFAEYGPKTGKTRAQTEAGFLDSPETSDLLSRFLSLVFG